MVKQIVREPFGTISVAGLHFVIDVLDVQGFGHRSARVRTSTEERYQALEDAEGQDGEYIGPSRIPYTVRVLSVDPQYDVEPERFLGEVAVVVFAFKA